MLIGAVNSAALSEWISAIPFEEWPQQHRLADGLIRPAMVTDPAWHGFGAMTDGVVSEIMVQFDGLVACQRMVSAVMPGHSIPPHRDHQAKTWRCRVHVPLLSNDRSRFIIEGTPYAMPPGFAYRVDTEKEHAVTNDGDTPRIHFMFDVGKPC